MSQTNSYQVLLQKLDAFIRKYYLNQLIKGSLFSLALIGGVFLAFSFLEHEFYFSPDVRKVLFYSFILVSALSLIFWIGIPALRYFRLGKVISHDKAAQIIGNHFGSVSDKLLNILQLKRQSAHNSELALIEASINQKSDEIKWVQFPKAINLSKNRKYLRYALPPLAIIFALLLTAPSIITDSTQRIIRNNEEFAPDAPFSFQINNDDLEVPQYENFELAVSTEGQVAPEDVYITIDNNQYRLTKKGNGRFSYLFNTVASDIDFQLSSGRVKSDEMKLAVLLKPQLTRFSTEIDYPAYTGYKDENKENIGDFSVPAGSRLTWTFDTEYADSVFLRLGDQPLKSVTQRGANNFIHSEKMMKSAAYRTVFSNMTSGQTDSVQYNISVIPDQYPTIKVKTFKDSADGAFLFFAGEASDDYGLRRLLFHQRITRHKQSPGSWKAIPIKFKRQRAISYQHQLLLDSLQMNPGDEIEYYFEVFDNDGVNGSKSSRTGNESFALATPEELEKKSEQNSKEIKEKLTDNVEKAKEIQKELEKLREKLLNSKKPKWEDKKKLEELIKEQQKLKEQFEKAQEQFKENLKNQESLQQNHEEIMEKQEKLEKLFEEVVDKDMEKLMEDIQKLMEELEKEGATQEMQEMEMSEQEVEKEMDRLLELYKQLELEKDIRDQIDKLEKLAEKQEELAEKTEEQSESQEELEKEQEEINKEFEDIEKKQEEIEKKNEELEKPQDLEDPSEEMEDIEKDLDDAEKKLGDKENKSASESQKSAAGKMKKMAGAMMESMEQQQQEQAAEDIKTMRQLLENLVSLSFDQEDLVTFVGRTNPSTPRYVELTQQQFKLEDDFGLIRDSLEALAKRNFQVEPFITDKVNEITQWFSTTVDHLEQRTKGKAGEGQRKIMKNTNDLALMLSESLQKMQQQMANKMKGNQMCNNPGGSGKGGKVPMDKISEGQEKLGESLQKMKDGMKKGGGKEGGMSKEFAQAAARQAAMRRALEEIQKEKQEQGQGSQDLQKLIDEMDKMEIDLLNKRLDNQALKRQADIETRLLEAEKAERQREWDNKRKSKTAEELERKLPPSLDKYLKEREAEIDLYQKVSPELRPYYKSLVEEYYKSLK